MQGEDQSTRTHDIEDIQKKDWFYSYAISTDYTISDTDKIKSLFVTTGASTITVTLPTAADNTDRIIEVLKVDSGAGYVVIDGEGAETINGSTTERLISQYNRMTIKSNGSEWFILEHKQTYDTGWVSLGDWTDATITITHNFNKHLAHVKYRLYWSTSGADGSDNVDFTNMCLTGSYGQIVLASNVNAVLFQTGANGSIYIRNDGVTDQITSGYYRVILEVR